VVDKTEFCRKFLMTKLPEVNKKIKWLSVFFRRESLSDGRGHHLLFILFPLPTIHKKNLRGDTVLKMLCNLYRLLQEEQLKI
jgi:hypothetical protein